MRSFGGASRGMGGGSGGVGGGGSMQMLRTVQRAVRAGVGGAVQEPLSHTHASSTTTTNAANSTHRARQSTYSKNKNQPSTLSSSSTSSLLYPQNNLPISASSSTAPAWPSCSSPTYADEPEWECIDDFCDDFVFGTVPSKDELHHAVFALQEIIDPDFPTYLTKDRPELNLDMDIADQVSNPTNYVRRTSPFRAKLDWIEPTLQLCNPSMLQAHEPVHDAFHLLRNEPSVQRMVISLSSDKAVWDAVLNNEVVQELRESFNQDKCPSEKSDDDSDISETSTDFLSWIIVNMKAKVMELIDKITKLVNEFFHIQESDKTADRKADPLEEKLRASFLLSVMVMLIVVVGRASKA